MKCTAAQFVPKQVVDKYNQRVFGYGIDYDPARKLLICISSDGHLVVIKE